MAVTANITVSFGAGSAGGAGANAHLSAEIDGRADGLNKDHIEVSADGSAGSPSFAPGDTAHFLVFKSSGVTFDTPASSAGSISSGGGAISVSKTEDVSFAGTNKGSLQVPATAITETKWLGNALGALTVGADGTEVTASSKGVGIARVTYTCSAEPYGLTSPATLDGETDFSILVYILGHAPGDA